jgi:hypothetical protein
MAEYARDDDPETSHDAGGSVNVKRDRKISLDLFTQIVEQEDITGLTRKEFRAKLISDGYDLTRAESLRRRLSDLVRLGLLLPNGDRSAGSEILVLTKKMSEPLTLFDD